MTKAPRQLECVYCGSTENLTAEHAPPKLIFPKPWPSDLITVRACGTCNAAGSKDAEYFRLSLCVNPVTRDMSSVHFLKPATGRSLDRPSGGGFRQAFVDAIRKDVGQVSIAFDMARINAVIERTVRCLYFHEFGQRLPTNHRITVVSRELLEQRSQEDVLEFNRDIANLLREDTLSVVADRQFAFSYIFGRPFVTQWALLFYGTLRYMVFTRFP